MSARKKYRDFVESDEEILPDKVCFGKSRGYVGLTCPHCKVKFTSIPTENVASSKASKCKAHLAKCPAYECPSCDEDEPPTTKSTALVVHDKCIAEREVLKQEKSTLEQKLDAMTQQLSASREEAKQEREEARQQQEREREQARQSQDNLTSAINGVKSQLDRWEGGLVAAMECEFKFVRPITAETIPIQMRSRESQLALKYSKSDEVEAVNRERMLTQLSTKDKQISNLQRENNGLRSNLKSLDNKLKDALAEKETMVTRAVMKEKVMCAETESKRRYVDLKKQSITIHNNQNVTIEKLEAENAKLKADNAKLKGMLRKRPIPGSEEETRALCKRPAIGGTQAQKGSTDLAAKV